MVNIFSLFILLPNLVSASINDPMPIPIFLKSGFSSILEFDEVPIRVVLGDPQSFQVEKLERSLAIKALAFEATSNMFVYFKSIPPKLFILRASDDIEPSYYKKFDTLVVPKPPKEILTLKKQNLTTKIISAVFDSKKDYLIVEFVVFAGRRRLLPHWNQARLTFSGKAFSPVKLWSERKDVQKDTQVRARFIFYRPNIPKDLLKVSLIIPLIGMSKPIELALGGR